MQVNIQTSLNTIQVPIPSDETYDRSKSFVKKAGTIIFVSSIVIWFSSSYNFYAQPVSEDQSILDLLPEWYVKYKDNWYSANVLH
ncbi:hypothetical protein EfmAA242_26870 [Enterococcus faecium]|nr:hypothetical protein EfmAA242_26870 [Enterococcus faecium]